MENQSTTRTAPKKCRKNERGAALVTVLMISSLLIVAATALLLEASMNTANVTDATAEEQAYYAAESGIQTVLNVLRGNSPPNSLIDSSKPATDPVNRIDYIKAAKPFVSNKPGDTSTESRLSRWITYDATFPDRVVLGTGYTKQNGFAFKVAVENPDNLDNTVSYYTSGKIDNQTNSKTWTDGGGGNLTIEYVSKTVTNLDVSTGPANTDFGKFVISGAGTIPTRTRFSINVNMTKPYNATKSIRGYIESGTISNASVGTVKLFYDSQVFINMGSAMTLSGGTLIDQPLRIGYEVTPSAPNANLGQSVVSGTMTTPEPVRLVIRSTGFGPRGARKELEAVIHKNYFNGLSAPAPLMLIGAETGSVFNPGTSNATEYSGKDVFLKAFLPPIGTTNDANLAKVNYGLTHPPPNKFNGTVVGTPSNVSDEMPDWLQSPANLDATLQRLKDVADASGRYFAPGVVPTSFGNNPTATGITFVDGDLSFSGSGGGILVVKGNLVFSGGFSFNGLIIVTGSNGVSRTGGGSGILQGNMIVAPYNSSALAGDFLAPKYDISGGGDSDVIYNSNNVDNGLSALSNFVKGVAEK
jgi:hypothetical protein